MSIGSTRELHAPAVPEAIAAVIKAENMLRVLPKSQSTDCKDHLATPKHARFFSTSTPV
jgi:hypothetical protein